MRILAKAACVAMASCPGVEDPEDDSGELIVTGRIAHDLLVQALTR